MFGERSAQESSVRCVVRARVRLFEPEVGDDRQLFLDRFQRGKDLRQFVERAAVIEWRPPSAVTPHRDEHETEPRHRLGRRLGQGCHRGDHRVEQRQRQRGLHTFQEGAPR